MRVSDALLTKQFLNAFAQNRETSARALEQLADGRRVRQLSDDPAAGRASLALRGQLVRIAGYERSSSAARFDLTAIESGLSSTFDALTDVRNKALGGASGTLDSGEILAAEVEQLRGELLALGNTFHNGRYLFGGTETLQPPFGDDGVYVGNDDEAIAGIDKGLTVGTTVSGRAPFVDGGDIFQTLENLATALRNDDTAAIQTTIGELNSELAQVNQFRAQIGARLELIDNTTFRQEDTKLRLQTRVSELESVSLEQVSVELALASNSSEALAAAAARVLGRSLFDVLG